MSANLPSPSICKPAPPCCCTRCCGLRSERWHVSDETSRLNKQDGPFNQGQLRMINPMGSTMEADMADLLRSAAPLDRRLVVLGSAGALAAGLLPALAGAKVPVPYDWSASPPVDARSEFMDWMSKNRGEDPSFLSRRWDRFKQVLAHQD